MWQGGRFRWPTATGVPQQYALPARVPAAFPVAAAPTPAAAAMAASTAIAIATAPAPAAATAEAEAEADTVAVAETEAVAVAEAFADTKSDDKWTTTTTRRIPTTTAAFSSMWSTDFSLYPDIGLPESVAAAMGACSPSFYYYMLVYIYM